MNLEQQIVSLELAKKLKKLGVKQESYFFHIIPRWSNGKLSEVKHKDKYEDDDIYPFYISAFTVAELGEMLPYNAESYRYEEENYKRWICRWFIDGDISRYKHLEEGITEADARAKMLIYLLENKLITI